MILRRATVTVEPAQQAVRAVHRRVHQAQVLRRPAQAVVRRAALPVVRVARQVQFPMQLAMATPIVVRQTLIQTVTAGVGKMPIPVSFTVPQRILVQAITLTA